MSNGSAVDRHVLRREMRARRRALRAAERKAAARAIAHNVQRALLLRPGTKIALYVTQGAEVSTKFLFELARKHGCIIYLPRIISLRRGRMIFLEYPLGATLQRNRIGIAEPTANSRRLTSGRELDIAFVPLVAVDAAGWRVGSGAGFYDRYFAHRRHLSCWKKPKLVGLAYHFQLVPQIPHRPWDVPVDLVVTDRGIHRSPIHSF